MIEQCIQFMKKTLFPPDKRYFSRNTSKRFPFYTEFYATQVFFHRGGKDWEAWYRLMKRWLLTTQNRGDGNWLLDVGSHTAKNYSFFATAVALLILQTPKSYLPVFIK